MNLINANLTMHSTPEKRDTDFYSIENTKVIVMHEDRGTINIDMLHQEYIEKNATGIPYHYIILKNGLIYFIRSRVYRSELGYSYQNMFKNGIFILMEYAVGDVLTSDQVASLSDLLTMIVLQDNLLIRDIFSIRQIEENYDSNEFKTVVANVKDAVSLFDPYRSVGDGSDVTTFKKIVSGPIINTFDIVAKYTKVPLDILLKMNPHAQTENGLIPEGTTIFLPDNRVSGYNDGALNPSLVNMCYTQINKAIEKYKLSLM